MNYRVHIANASEAIGAAQELLGFRFGRYGHQPPLQVFHFGAYGDYHVAVWGENIEDGLETAAQWIAENAPGLIYTHEQMGDIYIDAARDLELAWPNDDEDELEQIRERAEEDMTYTESGYIPSHEWGVSDIDFGTAEFREIFEQSIEELTDLTDEDDEWWAATGISAYLGPLAPRLKALQIFPIGDFDDDELGVMLDAIESGEMDALDGLGWEEDPEFWDTPHKHRTFRFLGDDE